MITFIKRNGLLIVSGVLLLIMATSYALVSNSHRRVLEEQQRTIAAVGEDLTQVSVETRHERDQVSAAQSGGDRSRIAADQEEIGELLKTALTWESNAEYVAARESMMRTYKLSATSQFMTSFMPKPPINKDSAGNEYPYIDAAGLNSWLGWFEPKVLSVKGTEYRYLVLARVNSSSASGKATDTRVATFFLTVDDRGSITELSGFAATKETRNSGE